MRLRTYALVMTGIMIMNSFAPANAQQVVLGADWAKFNDKLWLGIHCQIADGRTREWAKSLTSGLAGFLARQILKLDLIDKAIDNITLAKGDAYCVYMWKNTRRESDNDFDRRQLLESESVRAAIPSVWHLVTFEEGATKASTPDEPDRCFNRTRNRGRSRCLTEVVRGSEKTKGFAACIEPTLPDGKKQSAVIAWGRIPQKVKNGMDATRPREPVVKNVSCGERESDFMGG